MSLILINMMYIMKNQKEGFARQRLFRLPEAKRLFMEESPINRSIYLTDLGHFPRSPGHLVCRPSGSESHILMFCLEGEGWVERGTSGRTGVGGRQAVLIPAGTPHAYGSNGEGGWNLYWAHFTGTLAESHVEGLREMEENGLLHLPDPEDVLNTFEEAWSAVTSAHSVADWVCVSARLSLLLGTVLRSCRAGGGKARAAEERVRKSMEWIRRHAAEPLTLPDMARQAGLSVPHYCALFKKHAGSSPVRYLQSLRLQRACELLDQTELPVQSVAAECGFENPFHFSRSFKSHIGVSPRAYRNEVKG
jgi:AraC family transcriptional regulator of arabinose operon